MKLFKECTTEEILELLGIATEVELPKLKDEKVTLENLEQLLLNYLYEKVKSKNILTMEDIELIKILFGDY